MQGDAVASCGKDISFCRVGVFEQVAEYLPDQAFYERGRGAGHRHGPHVRRGDDAADADMVEFPLPLIEQCRDIDCRLAGIAAGRACAATEARFAGFGVRRLQGRDGCARVLQRFGDALPYFGQRIGAASRVRRMLLFRIRRMLLRRFQSIDLPQYVCQIIADDIMQFPGDHFLTAMQA